MALVQLPTSIFLPGPAIGWGQGSTLGMRAGNVLDVENDQDAIVFQPASLSIGKSITKLGVSVNAVTASGNVDARLETVGVADGDPTGTLANSGTTNDSNKSQAVSATGWNEFALTGGTTVVADTLYACVFKAAATTNITLAETRRGIGTAGGAFPYADTKIDPSAVWVKDAFGSVDQAYTMAVGFSDGTWEHIRGSVPFITNGFDSIISTGVAEVGLEFQLPYACRLASVFCQYERDGQTVIHIGNSSYVPGDSGATLLSTASVDKDARSGTSVNGEYIQLSTPVEITADTIYRVVVVQPRRLLIA